jgi:predicted Zn-ribbon and HTH transcriptional regulator
LTPIEERNVEPNAAAVKQANQLYWRTDRSIADIAETLGVSRRALYELVLPESAGVACENCGTEVVFANRSAKSAQVARCPACGSESQLSPEDTEHDDNEHDDTDIAETIPPYVAGWPRASALAAEDDLRDRAFKIGSAAIAGAAVGALTAFLFVRRR